MKKRKAFFYPLLLSLLIIPFSCEEVDDVIDLMEEIQEDFKPEDFNEHEETNTTDETGRITLEANADYLEGDGSGEQSWSADVTIKALKINGDPGKVVYETQFKDHGFGVAGGRWNQIDYYHEYQGEIVNASEKMVLTFTTPVHKVVLKVGQMDPGEGKQALEGKSCDQGGPKNTVDESGKWAAYDMKNEMIGSGILLDEHSKKGKLPDSKGAYEFGLDTGEKTIKKLIIEATQWGGEERGCPTQRGSYATQPLNDSDNTEDNSEFNIMSISFIK